MGRYKRVKLNDDDNGGRQLDPNLPSQVIRLLERDDVSRYWQALALADVLKELNPIKVGCCRHCWGIDYQYQYTQNEFRLARRKHLERQLTKAKDKRVEFDEQGGDGFNKLKAPNPDCPECAGAGVNVYIPVDLEKLPPEVRFMCRRIKITKDGSVDIVLADQFRAMENYQRVRHYDVPFEVPNFDILPDSVLDIAVERAVDQGLVSLEDLSDGKESSSEQKGR